MTSSQEMTLQAGIFGTWDTKNFFPRPVLAVLIRLKDPSQTVGSWFEVMENMCVYVLYVYIYI